MWITLSLISVSVDLFCLLSVAALYDLRIYLHVVSLATGAVASVLDID
jgi:hypothetical protein